MGGLDGPLSGHFLYRVSEGRWVEAHGAHSELGPAFSGLRRMMSRYRLTTTEHDFDFQGGLVGYLGYELKSETEGSAAHESAIPDAQMFFVDRFCVIDHQDNKLFICALSNELTESAQLGWLRRMSQNISDIQPEPLPPPTPFSPFQPRTSRQAYLEHIHKSLDEIRHGETMRCA